MRKTNEFTISMLTSGIVGALVALPVIIIYNEDILVYSLKSALVGIMIGVTARSASYFLYRSVRKYRLLSLAAIFSIIAVGTGLGAWVLGLDSLQYLIAMTIAAEIIGITAALLIHRYALRLNNSLKKTQDQIREEKR